MAPRVVARLCQAFVFAIVADLGMKYLGHVDYDARAAAAQVIFFVIASRAV